MLNRKNLATGVLIFSFMSGSISAFADPASRAARQQRFQAACGEDIHSLCPNATGGRQQFKCITRTNVQLSPECSSLVTKMKARMAKYKAMKGQEREPANEQ